MQEGLFVFEAIDTGDCGQRRQMCEGVSSVSNINNDAIRVRPNPARDVISLDISDGTAIDEATIVLQDITGKTLMTTKSISVQDNHQIQLPQNIAQGIYILSVYGSEFLFSEKLIIE